MKPPNLAALTVNPDPDFDNPPDLGQNDDLEVSDAPTTSTTFAPSQAHTVSLVAQQYLLPLLLLLLLESTQIRG